MALPPVSNPSPIEVPQIRNAPLQCIEDHALDPTNNNILSLESALVLYEKSAQQPDPDLMETDGFDLGRESISYTAALPNSIEYLTSMSFLIYCMHRDHHIPIKIRAFIENNITFSVIYKLYQFTLF